MNLSGLSRPGDVLYNTKDGTLLADWDVISLAVPAVHELQIDYDIKNNKGRITEIRKYSFIVEHDPTPCMYSHAIIGIIEHGKRIEPSKLRNNAKTEIRKRLARIAVLVDV